VSGVTLDVGLGEIHAVIGPNGAGKSTLINLLSGDLAPSGGSIRYAGAEIAGLAADRIARLGVARSYQKTNIFAASPRSRIAGSRRNRACRARCAFVAPALRRADLAAAAERALAIVGLDGPAAASPPSSAMASSASSRSP